MALRDVTARGNRLASLIAMRDLLAERLEAAGARDVAAIARQLADVLEAVDALSEPEEANVVDEIARRREVRRADASESSAG